MKELVNKNRFVDKKTKNEEMQKSVKNKKRTDTFKKILDNLGGLDFKSEEGEAVKKVLEEAGYEGDYDEKTLIAFNALQRAKVDSKSFEVYRDTIGEKPNDKIELNVDAKLDAQDIINKHFNNGD